jgi:hypothetical protein
LQNCEQGQTDWSEIAQDGQDPHSLKAPAPSLTVTAAAAADGHGSAAETPAHAAQASSVSDSGTDDGTQARSWAGLVAGLGGLALGGVALMRSRNGKASGAPVSPASEPKK